MNRAMRGIGISCRLTKPLRRKPVRFCLARVSSEWRRRCGGHEGLPLCPPGQLRCDQDRAVSLACQRLDSRCRRDRCASRFWGRHGRHFRFRNRADLGTIRRVCHPSLVVEARNPQVNGADFSMPALCTMTLHHRRALVTALYRSRRLPSSSALNSKGHITTTPSNSRFFA